MHKYGITYTSAFRQSYQMEFEYSAETYGYTHANRYFDHIDEFIETLAYTPKLFRDRGGYRVANNINGIYIMYAVDDDLKSVTILNIAGNARYYKILKDTD